jgi:hypothetical protein
MFKDRKKPSEKSRGCYVRKKPSEKSRGCYVFRLQKLLAQIRKKKSISIGAIGPVVKLQVLPVSVRYSFFMCLHYIKTISLMEQICLLDC